MKIEIITEAFAIGSLILLALGNFISSRKISFSNYSLSQKAGYELNLVGWLLMGGFWFLQIEHYMYIRDPVNAFLCFLGLPFFCYLAYHEYLNIVWKTPYPALAWLGSMTVVAGGIYFFVERVPFLAGWFINIVAHHSAYLLELFNHSVTLQSIDYGNGSLWYRPGSSHQEVTVGVSADWKDPMAPSVNIILACTALQSMIIFVGGVLCTKADFKRRVYAFLATVPVIYFLNLIRNVSIIYLTYTHIWGDETFYYAHSLIGKGGSLFALIFLAVALFHYMPEMQNNILDLIDLPKRKKPSNFKSS